MRLLFPCITALALMAPAPRGMAAGPASCQGDRLTAAPFAGGSGTASDPYTICTAEQLANVNGFLDKHFLLESDIDMRRYYTRNPQFTIGSNTDLFSGVFDGNHHAISNFEFGAFGEGTGLFGAVATRGVIRNLGVRDAYLHDGHRMGGINQGFVERCWAIGGSIGLSASSGDPGFHNGGLVGRNDGTISDSYAAVHVSGGHQIGGLVGPNFGTIQSPMPPAQLIRSLSLMKTPASAV